MTKVLIDKDLFLSMTQQLALYREASRVMCESRWNELDWEHMNKSVQPVLARALARTLRLNLVDRILERLIFNSPKERLDKLKRKFADDITWRAEHDIYVEHGLSSTFDYGRNRNKPTYGNADRNEIFLFNRNRTRSGEPQYQRYYWYSFKKPAYFMSLIDHMLSHEYDRDEIEGLVSYASRHSKANYANADNDRVDEKDAKLTVSWQTREKAKIESK